VPERADKQPPHVFAGTDALDVEWLAIFIQTAKGNPPDELVVLVDIKDQHTVSTVLQVVADTWRGDVEQSPQLRLGR